MLRFPSLRILLLHSYVFDHLKLSYSCFFAVSQLKSWLSYFNLHSPFISWLLSKYSAIILSCLQSVCEKIGELAILRACEQALTLVTLEKIGRVQKTILVVLHRSLFNIFNYIQTLSSFAEAESKQVKKTYCNERPSWWV